jgi:uracil-DNA glycosylase family 4
MAEFYYPIPQGKQSTIVYDCDKCGLSDNPKIDTPFFPYHKGANYNGLVVLGQQPSQDDDIKSLPFTNKRAQLVRSTAFKNGINLKNQAAFVYALKCHGKKGSDVQYKCCRSKLKEELEDLRPKMILCFGEMAFKNLFDLKNKIAPTKLRGRLIPNYEFNCLVYTFLNPNDAYNYDQQYSIKRDIKKALKFWSKYNTYKTVDQLLQERKILEGITIHEIKNRSDLVHSLNQISKLKRFAFDYETTNVKPYDNNFEITHISFSTPNYAWVINESLWINELDNWGIIKGFLQEILPNPKIEKIIQNVKFERNCTRWSFDCEIVNTQDPMIASHVIDERRGTTSLDFQNLTRFGIPPYNDTVKSYLQKKEKDDKQNRIRQAPYEDMITYAGLDVITTYHNWLLIEKILPVVYPNAKYNYEFLHRGHKLFANMTKEGINISKSSLNELETVLNNQMDSVLTQISKIPEFIEYNNYLQDKVNIKKSTEKQLKTLTMKGKAHGDTKSGDKAERKPIRRKLSF